MQKLHATLTIIISVVVIVTVALFVSFQTASLTMTKLTVTSSAFDAGAEIPSDYTCDGAEMSPGLDIANIPAETKSLAFIMEDPDAPTGLWVHWVKWNIPPAIPITTLAENKEPEGVSGSGSAGEEDYQGPCPPAGKPHHYIFTFYALDANLDLLEGSSRDDLLAAMKGHIIGQGSLTGMYQRLVGAD